tara:strand:- start:18279 stop:19127 length:849 start_codon:yes stop_codon:yes gene_type:complete
MIMNKFLEAWEKIEVAKPRPSFLRDIVEMEYEELEAKVYAQEPKFVNELIDSLYAGDLYLLRNGFPEKFLTDLRDKVYDTWSTTPSSFHQMIEGCPDFHRIVDEEVNKNYVFKNIRHSFYWFPWNGDPMGTIPEINRRWRVFKLLGGFRADEYESNTPKDGIVDRYQVARYLPGIGISETHIDPYENQRTIISVYMSKRGVDYDEGGFHAIGKGGKIVDLEAGIEIGDIGICYATVQHGVSVVDPNKKPDWKAKDGRWWMGLYSNSSDLAETRAVGRPADIT